MVAGGLNDLHPAAEFEDQVTRGQKIQELKATRYKYCGEKPETEP